MHKFEIDSHHQVQECSICHLAHHAATAPEQLVLPPAAPEPHIPANLVLKGFQLTSSPQARDPPITV
ncbi:hypothetical protein [Photobacterium marinum]|uniref:hypothetical protein n=1 Tax=Photobacterium marinum TaxID=1056511 RepID=UPI0012FB9F92|nr:hypothetical protein [Photobacterium marinum]